MRACSWGFVLDGEGASAGDDLHNALAPRYSLRADGRPVTVRRTWLDTFDWRLHRAGLTLEETTGRERQLMLTGPEGEQARTVAGKARWPATAGALPDGPLRARLGPVVGVRALIPAARAVSVVRTLRVLNADGKTVARLTVDAMTVTGPGSALPARLTVSAVRGYQARAERICQRLAGLPGVTRARVTAAEAAFAAAGRQPGEYSGKVDVRLTGPMPARLAMRAVLLNLLDTMEANVAGTIRDTDIEFLHDLRVSVRRTRSALKLAGDVLPGGLAGRFRDEFRWLGEATTPTRDLDVYVLNYPGAAAGLVSATPADLAPFHDYLARRREAERRRLVRALRSPRFTDLAGAWRGALEDLAPPADGPTAAGLAADRIHRAHRRVLVKGAAITPSSPPERLHDLRKRCKELRYALEFFASLHDPATHREALRRLKGLQDCLGTFQDCHVQNQEIAMFASQMMAERAVPASALLAMGELAGQLARRQRRARKEFAGRFAEFASPGSQRRFRALTTGAGS